MPKGFTELGYNKETHRLEEKHIDYRLVERDGKTYAEPIGKPRGSVGIGDGKIYLDTFWPLEDTACSQCGVYGLVHTIRMGEYGCANCGDRCILAPSTMLHVYSGKFHKIDPEGHVGPRTECPEALLYIKE